MQLTLDALSAPPRQSPNFYHHHGYFPPLTSFKMGIMVAKADIRFKLWISGHSSGITETPLLEYHNVQSILIQVL